MNNQSCGWSAGPCARNRAPSTDSSFIRIVKEISHMPRWLYALLVFAVLTALFELLHVPLPPLLLFLVAALGIIPLAALIGQAVEQIAEHTGERIGGLLFATFGNATELIIGVFALRDGLVDVV